MTATWPKPDWECEGVRLYCGDCLEVLPQLPAGCIDAVVTDPPYGIRHRCNYAERGRDGLAACNDFPDVHGDGEPFDPVPILALELPTVLWGANHYADRLPAASGWLVWDKERGDDLDQATCELAWTNVVKGVRRFRHLWNGCMKASQHGVNYHPTEKPIALMRWCLELRWLRDFRLILDPFMGSGTTGVACVQTGRQFVGIEIEEKYFQIAVSRIKNELAQPFLPGWHDSPSARRGNDRTDTGLLDFPERDSDCSDRD